MDWFKTVKRYYDKGFYTNEQMKTFVLGKKITAEEYKTITSVDYVE